MTQHHGDSYGLLCRGLYHQVWGSMLFSLVAFCGFLGQPDTQGCCTAYWANISLEGLHKGMESLRRTTALRCLGKTVQEGKHSFASRQGAFTWHHTLSMWMENWLPGKTHVLSSHLNLLQFRALLQSQTPDLHSNFSSLSLPTPKNQVSMHPLNVHCLLYHLISSQPNSISCSSQFWLLAALKPIAQHWSSQSSCSPTL